VRSTLSKADGDGDAPLSGQDRPLGGFTPIPPQTR
jgi:hypothetical protein